MDSKTVAQNSKHTTITAHEAKAGYYDMRVSGSALVGWLSPMNGAVPGRLLTYSWDTTRECVSAVATDTREVWVQTVDDAIEFLSTN
jgi:hypothetical protein